MNKKKYSIPDGDLIIIRLNGDETVASILDCEFGNGCNGQAVAKRNPKDEYDAYIGARVALDRLFGKDFFEEHQEDEAPKKAEPKFHLGDIVRITIPICTFGLYEKNDVAVITSVRLSSQSGVFRYEAHIRSKERKGRNVILSELELTLLHRAKGAERA